MPQTATASRRITTRHADDPVRAAASSAAPKIPDQPTPAPIERKHPITGCRADTLFGIWLYPAEHLGPLVDAAWAIADDPATLRHYAELSAQQREERDAKPLAEVDEDGIVHLSLSGPLTKHDTSLSSALGGTSMLRFREQLRESRDLFRAGKATGVLVEADSWGGTAEGTPETAEAVRKTDALMPVVFHAPDKCASGCLWIATQGRRLTAGRGASVGSQGAVLSLMDRSENFKRQGLRPVIVSTGEEKAIGAPGAEITEAQRAVLQRHINQINEPFRQDVVNKRRLNDEQIAEVSRAGIHVGSDAHRVGLIDAVCTDDQALADLKSMISSGGAMPGSAGSSAAGNNGETPMQLTPAQLAKLKTIPGCEAATDANAGELVLAALDRQTADLTTKSTEITRLNGEVARVTAELNSAKANAPKTEDPQVIEARADAFTARMGTLVAMGKISKPLGDKITGLAISPAVAANPAATPPVAAQPRKVIRPGLFAQAEGGTVADALVSTFESAGAGPRMEAGERELRSPAATPMANPLEGNTKTAAQAGEEQGRAHVDAELKRRGIPATAQ